MGGGGVAAAAVEADWNDLFDPSDGNEGVKIGGWGCEPRMEGVGEAAEEGGKTWTAGIAGVVEAGCCVADGVGVVVGKRGAPPGVADPKVDVGKAEALGAGAADTVSVVCIDVDAAAGLGAVLLRNRGAGG